MVPAFVQSALTLATCTLSEGHSGACNYEQHRICPLGTRVIELSKQRTSFHHLSIFRDLIVRETAGSVCVT
jgi:hypothetical protein